MPFLLGALALAGAAYFWILRARNAANVTNELLDVANDVRLAARRFGFRRRSNQHVADTIEDPKVAVAALAVCFLELEDYPSAEQKAALVSALRENLRVSHTDAEELLILGRWIMGECNGASAAISRLSRKLHKLSGQTHFDPLMRSIQTLARFGNGSLSGAQKSALEDLSRAMKIT